MIISVFTEGQVSEADLRKIEECLIVTTDAVARAGLLLEKASAFSSLKRFDEARRDLQLAIELAPNEPQISLFHDYILASLLHYEGKYELSFEQLTILLTKHFTPLKQSENRCLYEIVQQLRAIDAMELRRYEIAVPILEEAIAFDLGPESKGTAFAYLGFAFFHLKDRSNAERYLSQALDFTQPDTWKGLIHLYLGITYAHLRRLRDAEAQLLLCESRALEWGLSVTNVYGWLSRIYSHLGDTAKAREYERLTSAI